MSWKKRRNDGSRHPIVNSQTTTRLAPSPTGALHLGNLRTFVLNYLMARQNGWRVLMRIEDIDGPRVKAGASDHLIKELHWLGLEWDEPIVYQSQRTAAYREALERFVDIGAAYPCTCSRKDATQAGSAPHIEDGAEIYPGTCRGRYKSASEAQTQTGRPVAWRVIVKDQTIEFTDEFLGPQTFNLAKTCGDFVIFKSDGLAAYQLAVIVDDQAAGVNAIIRGGDLLESTGRQIHLRRLLGYSTDVRYWHLPLVVGPDGRRLAKRHGDTRLAHYRKLGVTPQRILGLIGYWSGMLESRQEISLAELLEHFDLALVPKNQIVFGSEDDHFLRTSRHREDPFCQGDSGCAFVVVY